MTEIEFLGLSLRQESNSLPSWQTLYDPNGPSQPSISIKFVCAKVGALEGVQVFGATHPWRIRLSLLMVLQESPEQL